MSDVVTYSVDSLAVPLFIKLWMATSVLSERELAVVFTRRLKTVRLIQLLHLYVGLSGCSWGGGG